MDLSGFRVLAIAWNNLSASLTASTAVRMSDNNSDKVCVGIGSKPGIVIVSSIVFWFLFVWYIERVLTGENKNITGHTFRNVFQNPVKLQTGGVRHGFILAYGIHGKYKVD